MAEQGIEPGTPAALFRSSTTELPIKANIHSPYTYHIAPTTLYYTVYSFFYNKLYIIEFLQITPLVPEAHPIISNLSFRLGYQKLRKNTNYFEILKICTKQIKAYTAA